MSQLQNKLENAVSEEVGGLSHPEGSPGTILGRERATLYHYCYEDKDGKEVSAGAPVAFNPTKNGFCKRVADAKDVVSGIVVSGASRGVLCMRDAEGQETYSSGSLLPVLVFGSIFVSPSTAVKAGDPVSVMPDGTWGTGDGLLSLVNAVWERGAPAGGLALLRLR